MKLKITDQVIPCFGKRPTGCSAIKRKKCPRWCDFYKPAGCKDWIRVERGDEVWLIPPEEYFAKPVAER
jgi:hypothetical protein